MTKIYRVIGLIFALGLFSDMVFAESDSYIDAVYALGDSEIIRQYEIKSAATFGENASYEIDGYVTGFKEEMEKMGFSFILSEDGELVVTLYGERKPGLEYRINGFLLEVYNLNADLWMPLAEFNDDKTLLIMTDGTIMDLIK